MVIGKVRDVSAKKEMDSGINLFLKACNGIKGFLRA